MFCPNTPTYLIADDSDIHLYQLYTPKDLILHFYGRYKNLEFTQEEKDYYSIK